MYAAVMPIQVVTPRLNPYDLAYILLTSRKIGSLVRSLHGLWGQSGGHSASEGAWEEYALMSLRYDWPLNGETSVGPAIGTLASRDSESPYLLELVRFVIVILSVILSYWYHDIVLCCVNCPC